MERNYNVRVGRLLFGELRYAALFFALEFVPARTLDWPRAWILLGVVFVVRTLGGLSVIRVNPDLLEERSKIPIHSGQPTLDKILLPAVMATFAGVIAICSIDRFHLRLFPEPDIILSVAGLFAVVGGWSLVFAALRANAFATTVVRHQPDRQHQLIDSGVYSWVRHPLYMGMIPVMLGLSLWLGSWAGVLFSIVPIGILMIRITVEERVLRSSLPGYSEYSARVRKRLIPFVW
ncbi:MAG TPA: isoprenylcysteine carboxylmethyltransferase family protein [Gemmatimonadaceae bacterium]|nr:isoprenylcysteine carboxylmethyltransferase family protein [Gemmatimonadaceae bacterium]